MHDEEPLSAEGTMTRKALNPKLPQPYSRMSASELDAETEKFERELIVREGKPLTQSLRRKLMRAQRRRGYPGALDEPS